MALGDNLDPSEILRGRDYAEDRDQEWRVPGLSLNDHHTTLMASRCSLLLVAAQLCAALQLPQLPANGWALAARAPFLRRLVPPGLYDESGPSDGVSPAWRAASLALGSLPPNEGSEECAVDPGDMCLVPPATGRVIFLRHGESTWNQADRFTGLEDVPLSPAGEAGGTLEMNRVDGPR